MKREMSEADALEWTYRDEEMETHGGWWHTKAYSLRRGIPDTDASQPALTVGYDANEPNHDETDIDGYHVTVSYGVWTDSIEGESEGFVEGVQNIFDRGEVASIGVYDTEAEAQQAALAFTTVVAGGLAALGETWEGVDAEDVLPTPVADAVKTYRDNEERILELVPER